MVEMATEYTFGLLELTLQQVPTYMPKLHSARHRRAVKGMTAKLGEAERCVGEHLSEAAASISIFADTLRK